MKIEDYCAQKAYDVYQENYLRDNKDNLADIEKLNYQQEKDFIPQFANNLRIHILTFLDDYELEDRDTVRRGLTSILKNNFDNLSENGIVDASGKIDVKVMNTNLSKSVEEKLNIQSKTALEGKMESNTQNNVSSKENVDFNNPEEKKAFFDNLHQEYKKLEFGSKEYEKWMAENICSNYEDLKDEEKAVYDNIVRNENNYLDFEEDFKKDNPKSTDKEIQEAYLKANPEIDKEKFYKKREAYELAAQIERYKIQGNQSKVDELSEKFKEILETGIVTQEEIQEELDKKLKNTKKDNQKEEESVLPGVGEDDKEESVLLGVEEDEKEDAVLLEGEEDKKNPEKQVYNSIMMGSEIENELIQEEYTYDVEEKETLWDKIKNRFSKIKDGILKVINPNRKAKELNGVKSIDIAENNTPSNLDYVKVALSQEEQRANAVNFNNSTKEGKNSSIEVDKGDSLNLG